MSQILVSVCMITYKHESFIKQAIEGVLMQKCEFCVELIIADDNSPDNTKKIVESFKSHPNNKWIKYTRHEQNKGMMSNYYWTLMQANGKYISLCEGDDFWLDPLKLQKQVSLLEKNENLILSCTNVNFLNESTKELYPRYKSNYFKNLNLYDLLQTGISHTSTYLFRNKKELIQNFIKFGTDLTTGDRPLMIFLAQFGEIAYSDYISSTYRMNINGNWFTLSDYEKAVREEKMLNIISHFFNNDWKAIISINRNILITKIYLAKKLNLQFKLSILLRLYLLIPLFEFGNSKYINKRMTIIKALRLILR